MTAPLAPGRAGARPLPGGGEGLLPLHLLEKSLGGRVELLLSGDRRVRGTLAGFDEHMNVVLEDAEEAAPDGARLLGTVVVRGNHVVSVGLE